MRTLKPSQPGRRGGVSEAYRLMKLPSTYAGIALLFIASALIFLPEMPPTAKDFLMVAFACAALLPAKKD
jgi:hypothetical protein